jgi:hypothetical protein
MAMDIKIDKDKKLIEKTVTGQLSPELCMMVIYEIATIVNMHKDYGILIDIRDTDPVTEMYDMLSIASEISKHGAEFTNKIAFLVPRIEDRIRTIELWKSCIQAKGFEYDRFFDREAALEWLGV